MQDALEVRVVHADLAHLVEGVADVVDAAAALPDALRHQPGAPVQVELAHIGGMRGVGEKGERAHVTPGRQRHAQQAGRVHAAGHLSLP
jgi:hypothetical protein